MSLHVSIGSFPNPQSSLGKATGSQIKMSRREGIRLKANAGIWIATSLFQGDLQNEVMFM